MEKRKLRNDIILALAVITLAVLLLLVVTLTRKDGARAVVIINGEITESFPLGKDTEYDIITENGVNTLVIKDGKASIAYATCPDKICANHRAIAHSGETIVCIPNKVVIRIDADGDAPDTVN